MFWITKSPRELWAKFQNVNHRCDILLFSIICNALWVNMLTQRNLLLTPLIFMLSFWRHDVRCLNNSKMIMEFWWIWFKRNNLYAFLLAKNIHFWNIYSFQKQTCFPSAASDSGIVEFFAFVSWIDLLAQCLSFQRRLCTFHWFNSTK